MNRSLKVVSLYAGPGAGKSTTASGLFYKMKTEGFNVELVTEYAKDKVYEGHLGCLEDQIYIFAKQQRRLKRLVGHVEYAITDSPLFLSILYNRDYSYALNSLVRETYNTYTNLNFYIERCKPYVKIGRTQEEHEARELDLNLTELLWKEDIPVTYVKGDNNAVETILSYIKARG